MEALIRQLLVNLGEAPRAKGSPKTDRHGQGGLPFLTSGYAANVDKVLNGALGTS